MASLLDIYEDMLQQRVNAQIGAGGLLANTVSGAYDFAKNNPEGAGLLAGQFVPGAGTADFYGRYPDPMNPSQMLPSAGQNITQGKFLDAALQSVGLLGDALYGASPFTAGVSGVPGFLLSSPRAIQLGRRGSGSADTSYRLMHTPTNPSDGAARLDDMTGGGTVFPSDIYTPDGLRLYGSEKNKYDKESFEIIQSVKGKPDEEVTIYRAVPKGIRDINDGDFVTLSRDYAKMHAESGYGSGGDEAGEVIKMKVKVKDLYSDGNDLNEFGYFPTEPQVTDIERQVQQARQAYEANPNDDVLRRKYFDLRKLRDVKKD